VQLQSPQYRLENVCRAHKSAGNNASHAIFRSNFMPTIYQNPRSLLTGLGREFQLRVEPDAGVRPGFRPAIDIYEEASRFVVQADVPGVDAAALDITVEGDLLTIRGERATDPTAEGSELQRVERASGRFERSFRLPETAAGEGVEARYRHGVLTIAIPKTKAATPYRIEVTQH
jgi:HSP20 family protein